MHYNTTLHVCTAAKTSKKKPAAAESDDDVSEVQAVELGESTTATATATSGAGGATGVLSSHSSDDINIADTVSLLYPPLALRTPRQKRTQVSW
jgi:hypothetical protein